MKIYIASSFDEAATCEELRKHLERRGHMVPDVWWNVRTKDVLREFPDVCFYGSSLVQSIAARHWRTIASCDAVILVSNLKQERSFTGANVEVGFAVGRGIPVLSLGKLKRSAMYVPIIRCETIPELLATVDCIALAPR